jgi:hypothetical protein
MDLDVMALFFSILAALLACALMLAYIVYCHGDPDPDDNYPDCLYLEEVPRLEDATLKNQDVAALRSHCDSGRSHLTRAVGG